ncbi:MAG TPA: HdeD family acid-resistance protein [Isosphaeraceae bacterium]|jgi:uncharacterized membrane protein HdeD (DUF308 family)|nr:HdeD family acid-resistance protein [Isosphaeraceae bacterium]
MGIGIERGLGGALRAELEALHREWGWYLALGVLLIVLGMIAIAVPWVATAGVVLMFGILLIVGGIAQLVGAVWARRWSGVVWAALAGVLAVVVGLMALRHPAKMSLALTLLIAAYLLVGGTLRIVSAMWLRYAQWGWSAFGGALSVVLGLLIYADLPESALWVIGTFLGIDLLFQGWAWVLLALAVRRLPKGVSGP